MNLYTDVQRYEKLQHEDFDAIVTGELTHYAIWLEDGLAKIIADFFAKPSRKKQFIGLIVRGESLPFKIEIIRAIIPDFKNQTAAQQLSPLLKRIEAVSTRRNAFAHGFDVTPKSAKAASIHVELIRRAGKNKPFEVTPASHVATMNEMEQLLEAVTSIRKKLNVKPRTRSSGG